MDNLINWAQNYGVWLYMVLIWGFFISKGFKFRKFEKLFDSITVIFHFTITIIALIKVFFM